MQLRWTPCRPPSVDPSLEIPLQLPAPKNWLFRINFFSSTPRPKSGGPPPFIRGPPPPPSNRRFTVFEGDDDELRLFKVLFEHDADVLRVRQVERGVDLVEDVDGRRLEEKHGQDQRQGHQRALAAAQLLQTVLPHAAERHLPLESPEKLKRLADRESLGK